MIEGQEATVKDIVLAGYAYKSYFEKWEVFENSNSILYWNRETQTIDRIATYDSEAII
jgi:hypothetical protein